MRKMLALVMLLAAGLAVSACGRRADVTVAEPVVRRVEVPEGYALDEFNRAIRLYSEGDRSVGELKEVAQVLRKVVRHEPGFSEAWFNLGVVLEELGRRDEAISAYERSLSLEEGRGMNALANLGMIQLKEGRRDEAIGSFRKAVEVEPFNAAALNNLAVVARQNAVRLRDEGDEEGSQQFFIEAISNVRKVLAADPRNLPAYNNLALIYYELGRYQLAEMVCRTAMAFEERDAAIHNNLGLIYLRLNRVIEADRQFQAAIDINPDYVEALMNLGAITLNFRDYATAHDFFDRAVEIEPRNVWALLSRSVAARGMGEFDRAMRGYRTVLEIEPDNAAAHYNLAILQQDFMQQPREALQSYLAFMDRAAGEHQELVDEVEGRVAGLRQLIAFLEQQEKAAREAPRQPEPSPDAVVGEEPVLGDGAPGAGNGVGDDQAESDEAESDEAESDEAEIDEAESDDEGPSPGGEDE